MLRDMIRKTALDEINRSGIDVKIKFKKRRNKTSTTLGEFNSFTRRIRIFTSTIEEQFKEETLPYAGIEQFTRFIALHELGHAADEGLIHMQKEKNKLIRRFFYQYERLLVEELQDVLSQYEDNIMTAEQRAWENCLPFLQIDEVDLFFKKMILSLMGSLAGGCIRYSINAYKRKINSLSNTKKEKEKMSRFIAEKTLYTFAPHKKIKYVKGDKPEVRVSEDEETLFINAEKLCKREGASKIGVLYALEMLKNEESMEPPLFESDWLLEFRLRFKEYIKERVQQTYKMWEEVEKKIKPEERKTYDREKQIYLCRVLLEAERIRLNILTEQFDKIRNE